MKVLSLFSGGGLGDFGLVAAGMEIVGQVEIDDYCQKILAIRYPYSVKWKDIKEVVGEEVKEKCGAIDIITGGFPCQPFSNAGSKMGKSDDRHLWPEMFRIIQEVKPRWVVGENVSGFVDMALDDVCANLESAGYETTTLIFPAHALGAWHRRERVWIVANAKLCGYFHGQTPVEPTEARVDAQCESITGSKNVSHPKNKRLQGMRPIGEQVSQAHDGERLPMRPSDRWREYWSTEPNVGRVVNGCPHRVERLKMLGNGQVAACTYAIGKLIMDIENERSKK